MENRRIYNDENFGDFISGFVTADGSFQIIITRVNTLKAKYRVTPLFSITQHSNDLELLNQIKIYWSNKGHIIKDKRNNTYDLRYNSIKWNEEKIIPHFEKYPLKGQKLKDFEIWKYIIKRMSKDKLHLSSKGVAQIAELSSTMHNKKRSKMKKHIINNISRQLKEDLERLNYREEIKERPLTDGFICGLIQGDGTFNVTYRSNGRKVFRFAIGQAENNYILLKELKNYWKGIGKIYKINENYNRYQVESKKEIEKEIIPYLKKNKLKGDKGERIKKIIKYYEELKEKKEEELEELRGEVYNGSFEGKRRKKN